ncbi:hypothetical protein Ddye_017010 [Dipteronia dyeriana]|uniref:PPIase cyclophilin-type domain-containing protein n=1 Tax=Dipteronia dyeriana TaxID=168575 RepID=A0AAD9U8G1_9ROSI|nr:hypothetical protein Ddye_017010 [Dipteronia dyeriana]
MIVQAKLNYWGSYDVFVSLEVEITDIVPYNIPDQYSTIVKVIKQSEDQTISFCKAEFRKIRKELKLGDTTMRKSTSDKERVSQDKVVDDMSDKEKVVSEASLEKVVGSFVVFEKFDGDTANLEKVEPFSENVGGKSCSEWVFGSPVVSEKVDGDTVVEKKVETSLEKVVGEAWQAEEMTREDFNELVKPIKWFSNMVLIPYSTGCNVIELRIEKGIGTVGKLLHYNRSSFHNVVPGYMVHGGDITNESGTSGESIYEHTFTDENFVKHISPDILSMTKIGAEGNRYQFFICTNKAKWLDHKQVVFGQVVEGF